MATKETAVPQRFGTFRETGGDDHSLCEHFLIVSGDDHGIGSWSGFDCL